MSQLRICDECAFGAANALGQSRLAPSQQCTLLRAVLGEADAPSIEQRVNVRAEKYAILQVVVVLAHADLDVRCFQGFRRSATGNSTLTVVGVPQVVWELSEVKGKPRRTPRKRRGSGPCCLCGGIRGRETGD